MRFIKPCQFAAASQSYRFCWWSGLVPPQHRKKKKSFRILKSLPALGTQSTSGDWQQPWDPGSCSRSPGCRGSDRTREEEAAGHTTFPNGLGARHAQAHGAENAPWTVRAFTAAEASPLPSHLESGGSQPEQGRSSRSKWPPGQAMVQTARSLPRNPPKQVLPELAKGTCKPKSLRGERYPCGGGRVVLQPQSV